VLPVVTGLAEKERENLLDITLPSWLDERSRWEVVPRERSEVGKFVLYWMHNALRGHENPALDAAICLARQNGLPLLVYQGLTEDYPFASDRHHSFILQGARDVQRELASRGVRYVFHLQRRGDRSPHLKELTKRAAVLITEEMPVEPLAGWLERLAAATETPILTVDTACVVPMRLLGKPYTRAFEFRQATQKEFDQRISRGWTEQEVDCEMYRGELPFEPLDLQGADLAGLIGQCEIDHTIAPVTDTRGGSRAGYQRWDAFKETGLAYYAKTRNDAARRGVSRMSAYLHYGMVSPLRIAREADELAAEKFLDELLIWRELAFNFCFHFKDNLDSFDALPEWAKETLLAHACDRRDGHFSWERLARGHSDNRLWDACQRSLLKHGELHNNLRMTWGKAVLRWTRRPEQALGMIIDLNHRYALDGRDPCSYGGLLWCLGQFDRPFKPEESVSGTVRARPVEEHERRIDVDRYEKLVDRPITSLPCRVAVVGAGLAGLIAARTLQDHGLQVTVFDKSRGVGGRLSTRRAASGVFFDHGAQYFTARDCRFARYVRSWMECGLVQPWDAKIVELRDGQVAADKSDQQRFVGVPAMNSIAQHLAVDLKLQRETRIAKLRPPVMGEDGSWILHSENGKDFGPYDYVLINCPPKQAAELIPDGNWMLEPVGRIDMEPCWSVLVELESPLSLDYQAAFVHNSPLSWIACDSSKPGRPAGVTWIMHASAEWTERHLEEEADEVLAALLDAFSEATGEHITEPITMAAHRWRYAKPKRTLEQPCLWDSASGIGVCGDWCGGPRVEGAFLSGTALAGSVLRHLTIDRPAPVSSDRVAAITSP
jgi:photolyase PhrII